MAIPLFDKDVEVIQKLDDEPNDVQGLSPEELKLQFDQVGIWLKDYINNTLIPALSGGASGGGAANIGASVDDFPGSTVQAVLDSFNNALTDRYTKAETNSYVGQETNDLVETVNVDLTTGVITVKKKDGTQQTFDTALEKVPATMALVDEADGTYLVITNQDGSQTKTNVSTLIDTYTFNNSTEIAFSTSGSGNNKSVTASIRNNSIGMNKFTLEATQALEQYNAASAASAQEAESSAREAAVSAAAALASQNAANDSAATASAKAAQADQSAIFANQNAGSAAASAQSAQSNASQALSFRNAAQSAQTAAETAKGQAESARDAAVAAKNSAVAAQQSIEDMQVAATTLAPGSSATVTKTTQNGVVKLTYGIPRGEKGDKGEQGMGLKIMGYYESLSALQGAVPNPSVGDAYGVGTAEPYDIYIWDGTQWVNNGPIGSSGLPSGGTPGQILSKTETGQEWVDKPVMYVNVTESDGTYSADKTAAEIYDAVQSGYAVFARVEQDAVLWLYASSSDSSTFVAQVGSSAISLNLFDTDGETVCALSSYVLSGSDIRFTPASGLTADNVQDAIEEVAGKFPKPATVTLAASGWSSNAQTVTVNGVLADETAQLIQPCPASASQSAYYAAGILCTNQAANNLTFTCQTVPTADLTVYVVMQEVGA